MRKRAQIHFWNGLWFGRGHSTAQQDFQVESLNILFHHLSTASMLPPNQPYGHSKFTSPAELAGWRNFKLRNNKALLLCCFSIFVPFFFWQSDAMHTLKPPRRNGIPQHHLGLTMQRSVRTLIIYPGSQVCKYCQYKLMPCWNCWTKCYSEWIIAHRMDINRKRKRCRKMWKTSNNNSFYNLFKLQAWKKMWVFFCNQSTYWSVYFVF